MTVKSSPATMDSGAWVHTQEHEEQTRELEERYANGTLKQIGREWLGAYYEDHLEDHAKDLELALQDCLSRPDSDELRGLFTDVSYALDLMDEDGATAPRFSAQDSEGGRSVYTQSLSYYLETPEELHLPDPAAVDTPVQGLVGAQSPCEPPGRGRKCCINGFYDVIKHRVAALRLRRGRPKGRKESGEKARTKFSSEPSSGSKEGKGGREDKI